MHNKRSWLVLVGLLVAALARADVSKDLQSPASAGADARLTMRRLLADQLTYTRNAVVSGLAGLEDGPALAERLLRTQDEIGKAVEPSVGSEASARFTALLRDNALILQRMIAAARAVDPAGMAEEQRKWRANAEQIANLLNAANPRWPRATLVDLQFKQIEQVGNQLAARGGRDWRADIAALDRAHDAALALADLLGDQSGRFPSQRVVRQNRTAPTPTP